MFHVKQDASQFLYFANTLLETKYEFEQVQYVGGEKPKSIGFPKTFERSKILASKKHLENDMKRKMSSLGIELGEQRNIKGRIWKY